MVDDTFFALCYCSRSPAKMIFPFCSGCLPSHVPAPLRDSARRRTGSAREP